MRTPALLLLAACAGAPTVEDTPNLRLGLLIGPVPSPTPPEGGVVVPSAPLRGTFRITGQPQRADDVPLGAPRELVRMDEGDVVELRLEPGWWTLDATAVDAAHPGCLDGTSPVTTCTEAGWSVEADQLQVPASWAIQATVVVRPACACAP